MYGKYSKVIDALDEQLNFILDNAMIINEAATDMPAIAEAPKTESGLEKWRGRIINFLKAIYDAVIGALLRCSSLYNKKTEKTIEIEYDKYTVQNVLSDLDDAYDFIYEGSIFKKNLPKNLRKDIESHCNDLRNMSMSEVEVGELRRVIVSMAQKSKRIRAFIETPKFEKSLFGKLFMKDTIDNRDEYRTVSEKTIRILSRLCKEVDIFTSVTFNAARI